MSHIDELSAVQIAAGVSAGEFSAVEVAQASLDAIEKRDGDVQAFLQVSSDLALEAAAATDKNRAAGKPLGALAGVPVAFKDNMHLVGTRTTCASKMLENYESVFTATCVSRLLDAGATPVGKTNMDEFAFGSSTESSYFHPTANPWDISCVPGGSSGGSAAAVAAGEVTLSLGSDTGGSIRQPASFCGVVGFKPTYGVVSRYGVVAFGSSLDQVGPFGRSVEDVALAMNALVGAGSDPLDSTSQPYPVDFLRELRSPIEGKRIGIVRSLLEMDGISAEVRAAMQQAMDGFERAGAVLVDVELPHIGAAIAAYYVIAPCEAFSNLARFDGVRYGYTEPKCVSLAEQTSKSRAFGFGQEARRRQLLGAYLLSSEAYNKYYYPAQQVRTLITQDYTQAFACCDALLLPTSPTTAFSFGQMADPTQMYASDLFTISNNIVGNGGISVPMGLGIQTGMPVSVQLQGPAFADQKLLQIAFALEHEVQAELRVAPAYAGKGGELV
ncbi:Asp-tRNA(Asn)/Glu-tRNA(Gln) amidotransferase subunit GatA [Atopobium fossor]|uniref:Asp-tRNA(Asn)/Glu-tRNA(Gln) amidotransferase subunit GatA n=1 Tax=Atopobium fossor TaxID=39487 RepID=UPI0004091A93|nr:Asp-tRNA(Asn)/Glu-tRNA(Gln) amidotransferase subunit GatA [Atopobium fossor]